MGTGYLRATSILLGGVVEVETFKGKPRKMEGEADDAALRGGIPVQVHAYISPSPVLPAGISGRSVALDASAVRVRDGKVVELVAGSDIMSLRVDHAYHQPPGTERDVIDRSLQPIIKASVEGVNTAVLAVGSLRSSKSDLVFRKMDQHGLIAAILQSLLTALEAKASAVSASSAAGAGPRFTFTIRVSAVELYEERVQDLLASGGRSSAQVTIVDGKTMFKQVAGASTSQPIRGLDSIKTLVEAARLARCKENGLYGNAAEFSCAIVRIHIHQTFAFQDAPTQQLVSTMDIVDLPPTDRLSHLVGSTRLSEGPLLNKSLFALSDCIGAISEGANPSRYPPFGESQLTQLLQDTLWGNCLTFAMLFFTSCDVDATRATFQLGKKLQSIKSLPVVNNDIVRGLLRKYFLLLHQAKQAGLPERSAVRDVSVPGDERGFLSKIHELEGKLAQETLEKRLLKEDKDNIVAVMNELKAKYQQLFNNEIEIRKELLTCEQEKLTLSKAFVEFQMDRNARLQDLDNDKFELETKLIQAEEMVLQIQQDDNKKASQIQDLCQKMNEIVQEKKTLGEELALLQKHCQDLESTCTHENKKNQQLSLELIVLVNQRQKSLAEMDGFEARNRDLVKKLQERDAVEHDLQASNEHHQRRINELEQQVEAMRKEIARREIDIEKLELTNQRARIDFEKQCEGIARNHETEQAKALATATAQKFELGNQTAVLQQQLQQVDAEYKKCEKEKEIAHAAWVAKNQDYEELLVANERLQHEIQSETEDFRLRLSFITSKSDVMSGIRELIQSYQRRERELRGQVAVLQQRIHRLRGHQLSPDEGSDPSDYAEHATTDLSDVRQRLHEAELNVIHQIELVEQSTAKIAALQQTIDQLRTENAELKSKTTAQTDRADLGATHQLQKLILQQLDEIRTLSLSQGSREKSHVTRLTTPIVPTTNQESPTSGLHPDQLVIDKKNVEQKLATSEADWMRAVERVEKRCADLLTKNIMLNEENEQLRSTMKNLIIRLHSRR